MQEFLNSFFFYDKLPEFIRTAGETFGFDTACLCSFPNFFNFALHFIIAALILVAINKAQKERAFLSALLIGVIFSGLSKLIDWTQNMFTATGETVFWSNALDIAVEGLQFVGMAIILAALFIHLRQISGKPRQQKSAV